MERRDVLSMTLPELTAAMADLGEKPFRAKQIYRWLHMRKAADFSQMTDLSAALREKLVESFCINSLFILKKLESARDNTVKYLYGLSDGNCVESVLMSYQHGDSICISTQVGCKMGCAFCASAIAGFVRNLTPGELLAQIDAAERDSGRSISSVVLMGIGEPLDNFESVMRFLELLSDPQGRGLSLRHVTLSTCGLVPQIDRLAERRLGLTLAVSLHAAEDQRRSEIMPVNRRYPLSELMAACRRYFDQTGRRLTFEYSVIDGVNDSQKDAERLAALLKGMSEHTSHINLIPVNAVQERSFHATRQSAVLFQKKLEALGMHATVRRTLGSDIQAACGQLRRVQLEEEKERGDELANLDRNQCGACSK